MYIQESFDVLKFIHNDDDSRQKNPLHSKIDAFLQRVFECNGFIAGGFAATVARIKNQTKTIKSSQYVNDYSNLEYYLFYLKGDIDVYFPDQESLELAKNNIENHFQQKFSSSLLGTAFNMRILFRYNSGLKLSLVQCQLGTPEEVIENFDITNAKVAITKDSIIMHNAWLFLEQNQILDVSNWNNKFEFYRIKKYLNKWNYLRMSKRTANQAFQAGKLIYSDLEQTRFKLQALLTFINERERAAVNNNENPLLRYLHRTTSITIQDVNGAEHDIPIQDCVTRILSDLNDVVREMSKIKLVLTCQQSISALSEHDIDTIVDILGLESHKSSAYNVSISFRDTMKKFISDYKTDDFNHEFSDYF